MATRDEIGGKIREFLNDSGYFYSPDDINNSLQDAYDEVCAYTGVIEKMVAVPFTVNTIYYDFRALIPDFLSLVAIWNRRVKRWMSPASDRELDKLRENWESAVGEPYIFWPVNYRYVAVFPAIASVGTEATNYMYVVYKAQADTLLGTSEPQIPMGIQEDILSSYCNMDMYEQAEEWVKANEHLAGYTAKVSELQSLTSKRDGERLHRLGGSI